MDWRRVTFTTHMTEVACVVGECHVVLDFGAARVCYEVKVYEALKGGDDRYFAVGTNPDDPQGYRPVARPDGSLAYELKPGPLVRLAQRAARSPAEHVLLIDELNRGNLPRILGELMYLLEYRESDVALLYGDGSTPFRLPANLLILATMNTADRSIGLVDAALRRRFGSVAERRSQRNRVRPVERLAQPLRENVFREGSVSFGQLSQQADEGRTGKTRAMRFPHHAGR